MIHFERRGGAKILPNYVWILNEDAREKLGGGGQVNLKIILAERRKYCGMLMTLRLILN